MRLRTRENPDDMMLDLGLDWYIKHRWLPRLKRPFVDMRTRYRQWRCGRSRTFRGYAEGHDYGDMPWRMDDWKSGIGHLECSKCDHHVRFLYNHPRPR